MNNVLYKIVILAVLTAVVHSGPIHNNQIEQFQRYTNYSEKWFNWGYVLSDRRNVQQSGSVKELPNGTKFLVMSGSYTYVGPDGIKYTVVYYADETGYHPTLTVGDGGTTIGIAQAGAIPDLGEEKPTKPNVDQPIDPKLLASLVG